MFPYSEIYTIQEFEWSGLFFRIVTQYKVNFCLATTQGTTLLFVLKYTIVPISLELS